MARGVPSRGRAFALNTEAASSVIASVTMVGMVVVLGAAAAWFAFGAAPDTDVRAHHSGIVLWPAPDGAGLDMEILSGDPVPIQRSKLILVADGARHEYALSNVADISSPIFWSAGDRVCLVGQAPTCLVGSAAVVDVMLVVDDTVIYHKDARLTPFTFTGSGVQVQCAGPVGFNILHVASTYGPLGPGMAVEVGLSKDGGGQWNDPFGGAVATGQSHTEPLVAMGSLLALRGHATATGLDATYDSHPSDPHVHVGADGTTVPSVLAFGGAGGVEDALEPYVDFVTGTFQLEVNEVIVLWEYDPAILSATADYQDLVVLLTLPPAGC